MNLEVFTDGSCWPNPSQHGGWAFVVYQRGIEVHSAAGAAGEHTTNNRMEMMGVLRALEWLGDRPARIFSDSQYVVNGVNIWSKAWQKRAWTRRVKGAKDLQPVVNTDLWKRIQDARREGHTLHWVRGHANSIGNCRADQLAEAARIGGAPC